MNDRTIKGHLAATLVYKSEVQVKGEWVASYHTFVLVIVEGESGPRVATYHNGVRLGRSVKLDGANAPEAALPQIAKVLRAQFYEPRQLLTEGIGVWSTDGTITLIARS